MVVLVINKCGDLDANLALQFFRNTSEKDHAMIIIQFSSLVYFKKKKIMLERFDS